MRLQFEKIEPEIGSSFKAVHHREPNSCWVFWHYHPEYEIVYLPFGNGKQHIGQHISTYENGQLLFIGPNIPHLNLSYGVEHKFEEVVVQLRDDFLGGEFFGRPELTAIRRLFERARLGLSFGLETRQMLGPKLIELPTLPPFERMLSLLAIFQHLATTPDVTPLHAEGILFDPSPREQERINRIYKYVEVNYAKIINLEEVAEVANLTVPAFCRYFKKVTQMTFTEFVNEYRVNQAQRLLHSSRTVADVGFAVGFNNLSHFNKSFKAVTGQTTSAYREELV